MEKEMELKKERDDQQEWRAEDPLKQRAESPQGRMGSVIKEQKEKIADRIRTE